MQVTPLLSELRSGNLVGNLEALTQSASEAAADIHRLQTEVRSSASNLWALHLAQACRWPKEWPAKGADKYSSVQQLACSASACHAVCQRYFAFVQRRGGHELCALAYYSCIVWLSAIAVGSDAEEVSK